MSMGGLKENEKKALEQWFASFQGKEEEVERAATERRAAVPREPKPEKPVIGVYGGNAEEDEIKPEVYTLAQLREEMENKTKLGKRLLEEVVKWHERRGIENE